MVDTFLSVHLAEMGTLDGEHLAKTEFPSVRQSKVDSYHWKTPTCEQFSNVDIGIYIYKVQTSPRRTTGTGHVGKNLPNLNFSHNSHHSR